jgi:hypothetical protein
MPRAGFKPTTPATERPQTYALDHAATEIGNSKNKWHICNAARLYCHFIPLESAASIIYIDINTLHKVTDLS